MLERDQRSSTDSNLPEIEPGWEPYAERYARQRIDRELEASLLRDHLEHAEHRKRMPAAVRRKEDGEE